MSAQTRKRMSRQSKFVRQRIKVQKSKCCNKRGEERDMNVDEQKTIVKHTFLFSHYMCCEKLSIIFIIQTFYSCRDNNVIITSFGQNNSFLKIWHHDSPIDPI